MWLNGAVADEINSPDTAQTHRPLNVPQRIPHHESRAPVRKHICCCLAKSTPQLGKKQWLLAEATTGLRRCSHPHSSVIYHTTDMHAWPGASQTRHTVGIGSSCLIIALHSNAAHYLNVSSLMVVIKHPMASLVTHIFSLLVLLVKHKAQWLVSNDVKW